MSLKVYDCYSIFNIHFIFTHEKLKQKFSRDIGNSENHSVVPNLIACFVWVLNDLYRPKHYFLHIKKLWWVKWRNG